jgi:hypothetical protein
LLIFYKMVRKLSLRNDERHIQRDSNARKVQCLRAFLFLVSIKESKRESVFQ